MVTLTAYMDETGHSKDQKQKFNGMAGWIATTDQWQYFERRWKKILKRFQIPYIHMKESREMFDGWSELKIRKLSAALWDAIEETHPFPIGSIIPMDEFRPLEARLREYLIDPYFITMQDCMRLALPTPLQTSSDVRVALIFSEQVEFKYVAQVLFDMVMQTAPAEMRARIDPPTFRNMRDFTPLQAADMLAYEVYKETEREYYGLTRKQRYGYNRISKALFPVEGLPTILPHSTATLTRILETMESNRRRADYWAKRRAKADDH